MQTTDRTRNLESAPSALQYSSTVECADTRRAKSWDFFYDVDVLLRRAVPNFQFYKNIPYEISSR